MIASQRGLWVLCSMNEELDVAGDGKEQNSGVEQSVIWRCVLRMSQLTPQRNLPGALEDIGLKHLKCCLWALSAGSSRAWLTACLMGVGSCQPHLSHMFLPVMLCRMGSMKYGPYAWAFCELLVKTGYSGYGREPGLHAPWFGTLHFPKKALGSCSELALGWRSEHWPRFRWVEWTGPIAHYIIYFNKSDCNTGSDNVLGDTRPSKSTNNSSRTSELK